MSNLTAAASSCDPEAGAGAPSRAADRNSDGMTGALPQPLFLCAKNV